VISAALACVDEQGAHEVRLQDVAERAGVSKAWILSVYPSRSALIAGAIGGRFSSRVRTSLDLLTKGAGDFENAALFLEGVASTRGRGEHVLNVEEVWQFLEVLAWSGADGEVAAELSSAKIMIVDAFEGLTTTFDDRGWLHSDVGPVSAAVLLMASLLVRVVAGSSATQVEVRDDSLLLITLSALLQHTEPRPEPVRGLLERSIVEGCADWRQVESESDPIRERILTVASQELSERGPLNFRIQTVMERAEVSSSVLYRKFANRNEVMERAAVRLAAWSELTAMTGLSIALDSGEANAASTDRERTLLAITSVFEWGQTMTPESLAVGLTRLVSGRRIESSEEFQRRRSQYLESVARAFMQRVEGVGPVDPRAYAEMGPLVYFLVVILANFPSVRHAEVSLAAGYLRVLESVLSLDW